MNIRERWAATRWWQKAALVIAAFWALGYLLDDGVEPGVTAYHMCMDQIRASMYDPSSARLPSLAEVDTGYIGVRQWRVAGTVRGTNAFGGVVPNDFVCTAAYDEAEVWSVTSLEIEPLGP